MRAAGLAATTVARRVAALRSFFRHPCCSAPVTTTRRRTPAPPPRPYAAAHALAGRGRATDRRRERHHAAGDARPGARRADVRRGPAGQRGDGLQRRAIDLEDRLVRAIGKGSKERIVPLGRPAVDALRRYIALGRPHLDRRNRPELFLNARGGPLTRAGAFLILRRLAEKAGSSRSACTRTCSATPSRRTSQGRRRSAQRPGDARARRSRPPPSSTPTYPIAAAASCTSERTRMRDDVRPRKGRPRMTRLTLRS